MEINKPTYVMLRLPAKWADENPEAYDREIVDFTERYCSDYVCVVSRTNASTILHAQLKSSAGLSDTPTLDISAALDDVIHND